jgi:hypothetical protein
MVLVRKRRGGRRHKKLKAIDPFYSGPRKLLVDKYILFSNSFSSFFFYYRKLAGANQVPKKGEKISHRFQEFLDNKQHAQEFSKKKNKNKNKFKQNINEDNEHPELEQKPNESDRNYIQRLDQVKLRKGIGGYTSRFKFFWLWGV